MIDASQVVVAVFKEGSLTGAATRLGLSVATVSRRLAELEQELGVVLFERSTRSLRATAAGAHLAFRLERGLSEVESAFDSLRAEEESASGIVRLSVPPNLGEVLAPLFDSFRQLHPLVRLHVQVTERRVAYADEDVDVMLRVGSLETEELVAHRLLKYRHLLCACPEVARGIKRIEDLKHHAQLVWGTHRGRFSWALERDGKQELFEAKESLESNDYGLIAAMLKRGGCVGELPAIIAQPLLDEGSLERVLPGWQLPEVELTVLYSPRLLPRSVRLFIDHVKGEFSSLVNVSPRR